MKHFIIIILLISLIFTLLPAQDLEKTVFNKFLVYTSRAIGNYNRTDLAVVLSALNDRFYYGIYFNHYPGFRFDFPVKNTFIFGISIRDNNSNYYVMIHEGVDILSFLRFGIGFAPPKEACIEFVFSFKPE